MSTPSTKSSFSSPSFSGLSLTSQNIHLAHDRIKPYIHRTPLLTCQTLNHVASTPRRPGAPSPKINLYFKCENYQKIGAFKARGAFHAVIRLIEALGLDEVRSRGVVTHSSGNHTQALSLAASTFAIPAYIVMPTISAPSKIAATQALTNHVIFSGSTSQEREERVKEVIEQNRAILVPPYDHADIILGQGTVGLEMEEQFAMRGEGQVCTVYHTLSGQGEARGQVDGISIERKADSDAETKRRFERPGKHLDAIIAPCGGGGLLSGIATYFSDDRPDESRNNNLRDGSLNPPESPSSLHSGPAPPPSTLPPVQQKDKLTGRRRKPLIFGAEPTYQGADDALRSLHQGKRIERVQSLTIADGLRTPLGPLTWTVISDRQRVQDIYGVTEGQIKSAMRLLFERAKWVVEPSAAVPLAVVLYNERFRRMVQSGQEREGGRRRAEIEVRPWNVGVVLSGGNTSMEAVVGLFGKEERDEGEGNGEEEKGGEGEEEREGEEENKPAPTGTTTSANNAS